MNELNLNHKIADEIYELRYKFLANQNDNPKYVLLSREKNQELKNWAIQFNPEVTRLGKFLGMMILEVSNKEPDFIEVVA